MLIFDQGFPEGYQQNVRDAVGAILRNPNGPKLPQDLKAGLVTLLDGIEPSPSPTVCRSVMIAYDDRVNGPYAYAGGVCIWLCKRSFEEEQDRVNAVLFHELVHVLCGWELDAEIFESLMFNGQGATPPDHGDVETFARKNWMGRWVRVVRQGDDVVVRNLRGGRVISLRDDLQSFLASLTDEDLAGIPNG